MLDDFDGDDRHKGFERYVDVTCEDLVLAHLEDALAQLQRWPAESIRLFFAARSVHAAMVAALTTALAGTDGMGAFSEKLRAAWLTYFECNDRGSSRVGLSDRVMSFKGLLEKAKKEGGGWLADPITVDEEAALQLKRLTQIRDTAEHPKPGLGAYQPAYVLDTLPVAIDLTDTFLTAVRHRLDALQEIAVARTFRALREQVEILSEKCRASDEREAGHQVLD